MKELIYNSKHQNLHMDRANKESMKTVNVTINTNLSYSTTPRLVYRYKHGYDYVPQFWGLWDIDYFPNSSSYTNTKRGYGYITHNTGAGLAANFYYTVDAEHVNLYFIFNGFISPKPNVSGTKAIFTGYSFANGRNNQDYTE